MESRPAVLHRRESVLSALAPLRSAEPGDFLEMPPHAQSQWEFGCCTPRSPESTRSIPISSCLFWYSVTLCRSGGTVWAQECLVAQRVLEFGRGGQHHWSPAAWAAGSLSISVSYLQHLCLSNLMGEIHSSCFCFHTHLTVGRELNCPGCLTPHLLLRPFAGPFQSFSLTHLQWTSPLLPERVGRGSPAYVIPPPPHSSNTASC